MIKISIKAFLLIGLLSSSAVFANVITTIGPLPYIAGGPEQHLFTSNENVRIFQQIDLTALTIADDFCNAGNDCTSLPLNQQWKPNDFVWSVDLIDPNGVLTENAYDVFFSWTAINAWQTNPAFTRLNFFTDSLQALHGPLISGVWTANTFFEGVAAGSTQFTVPVPTSLALLSIGLMGLGFRSKKGLSN